MTLDELVMMLHNPQLGKPKKKAEVTFWSSPEVELHVASIYTTDDGNICVDLEEE